MEAKKNILLYCHHSGTPGGPFEKINNYLKKNHNLFIVQHPLFLNQKLDSLIEYDAKREKFRIYPHLQFFLEGLFTLYHLRKLKKYNKIALAICFDPLSFFHIHLLKHLLKVEKIVYYNVDYSKTRFNNKILNFIYIIINMFAYKKCDYFFSLTKKFIEDIDPKGKFTYKNFIVKNLVSLKKINLYAKKIKNSIVHAGSINKNIDFEPLLLALKILQNENIDFVLDIYGGDKPNNDFIKKIIELKLEKNIFLKGVVDNKILINNILPKYNIGVCPYMAKDDPLTDDHALWGNDLSAKLVEYIAAGLPIITTKYDYFNPIEENKFGYLVNNSKDWYFALKKLLTKPILYRTYRKNALIFAKNYDEEKVLKPIFKKILP